MLISNGFEFVCDSSTRLLLCMLSRNRTREASRLNALASVMSKYQIVQTLHRKRDICTASP